MARTPRRQQTGESVLRDVARSNSMRVRRAHQQSFQQLHPLPAAHTAKQLAWSGLQ
jgi:hypothetical protein